MQTELINVHLFECFVVLVRLYYIQLTCFLSVQNRTLGSRFLGK